MNVKKGLGALALTGASLYIPARAQAPTSFPGNANVQNLLNSMNAVTLQAGALPLMPPTPDTGTVMAKRRIVSLFSEAAALLGPASFPPVPLPSSICPAEVSTNTGFANEAMNAVRFSQESIGGILTNNKQTTGFVGNMFAREVAYLQGCTL